MNVEAFLLALALVESGGDDLAIGKAGERGRYQISRAVWKQHAPKAWVFEQDIRQLWQSEVVAVMHIKWLASHTPEGKARTVRWTAAAWNCGLDRCQKARWRFERLPKTTQRFVWKVERRYRQ
jgi:hypothetical protein